MGKVILIVIFAGYNKGGVEAVEMDNMAQCLAAKTQVAAESEKLPLGVNLIAVCVEGG